MKPKAPLTTIITPIAIGLRITQQVTRSRGVGEEDGDQRGHQPPVGEASAEEDADHGAGAAEQQVERHHAPDRGR